MKQDLRIGFLPLSDCAVLVVAQERGLFEKYDLSVTLEREVSWANIRDRVAVGELDAAHMLAPMPLAATLGIDGFGVPMQAAFSLGLNGSAITLSKALMQELRQRFPQSMQVSPMQAKGIQQLLQQEPDRKLVFASVYDFSQHHYLLLAWLRHAGLKIGRDVEIRFIPPLQMVNALQAGEIDGFCVGEPWDQLAMQQGVGHIAVSSYELMNNGPEKVLGVTQSWAEENPDTYIALLKALFEASAWLDSNLHNRLQIAEILAQPQYLDISANIIAPPLRGHCRYAQDEPERYLPDFNVFHRYAANFPWLSHGEYFFKQMQSAGQLKEKAEMVDMKTVLGKVYRVDIYRQAAQALGLSFPLVDELPAGQHAAPWVLSEASQPIAMGSTASVFVED